MKPCHLISFGASPIALTVAVVCLARTVNANALFRYLFGRSDYLAHRNTVKGTQLAGLGQEGGRMTDAWIHP